jgi:hypothetical protein
VLLSVAVVFAALFAAGAAVATYVYSFEWSRLVAPAAFAVAAAVVWVVGLLPRLVVGEMGVRDYPSVGMPKTISWGEITGIENDNGAVLKLALGGQYRVSSLYITGIDRRSKKQMSESQTYVDFLADLIHPDRSQGGGYG